MKRTTSIVNLSAIVMLSAVLITANAVAYKFAGTIDLYLSKSTIDYNSEAATEALTQGKSLAREIVEDGQVLLKNENGCLPVTSNKINIFGWGGCDNGFLYQGGGSSEGGYSADKVSLYQAFRNTGFEINEDLANAYNNLSYRREGAPDQDQFSTYFRLYEPGSDFYTSERMNQAKNFSDTAIMVFSRRATEGDDLPKVQYDENGNQVNSRNYLGLSDKEAIMVSNVTANFDKVIVLFNTSAPMESGFVDYDGIDAAISVGYPGYYGTTAIAEGICGLVNYSGHLVDTAAYSLNTSPTYVNCGNEATHTYSGRGGKYTDYAEDIYSGYKWYETADAEGYWDNLYLNSYGHDRYGYDAVIQYPFGYGLSYTNFSWEIESITVGTGENAIEYSENSIIKADDTLTFKVWVENTGSVKGRDVVQLYYSAPYTKGGIEKSSVRLVDFQKTAVIEPGVGEELTFTTRAYDLASYDTYDKNNNGFMGYELEGGKYNFSFRTDSHNVKKMKNSSDTVNLIVPTEGYKFTKDPDTGTEVKNRFTNYTNTTSGAVSTCDEPQALYALSIDGNDSDASYNQGIKYLTRADFANTFPTETPVRNMGKDMYENVFRVHDPLIDENDVMPTTNNTAPGLTLQDVKGLDYDDPKWQTLIEELSVDELATLSAHGGFGTDAIEKIGKAKATDSDGGTGFTSSVASGDGGHATKYPAASVLGQTWDWKKAYKWGNAIGTEGQALNIQGWYAPGCNVHRSPLGGRNFEYFSEDGIMCGVMCGWTVKGCTDNGVYAYMKHFAGNDSDAGRNGQFKWMTEQSLRENWAKPGELATKIGNANAIMVSVDRIGSVRGTGSYALLTSLLRDEWGFRGSAITDYYQGGNVNDIDEGIRCGNDLALHPSGTKALFNDTSSATSVIALQNAAHNILYTYIDTIYRTETNTGIDLSGSTGVKNTSDSGTWWRPVLISADCVIAVGFVAWAGLAIYFTWFRKKRQLPLDKE
ncbi:MAG: glycoside hydrolase family 3 N-terminal domain-containing protein [Bacilli bacterium]